MHTLVVTITMKSQLYALFVATLVGSVFTAEKLNKIITRTDECFQCGMIELFGAINLKVFENTMIL